MRHAHLHFEDVLKQEDGIARLADAFLAKQALRPEPAWYAGLLEEHQAEISAAVLLWLLEVQDRLSAADLFVWTDPFLWIELEERLALLLVPALQEAARAAARRQAVEEGEPIPLRLADFEIASWAGVEAARQARLIAGETRLALIESMIALDGAGLAESQSRDFLLGAGLYALNRRFAAAAVRPVVTDGSAGLEEAKASAERLLEVRRRMIEEYNAVSSVTQGLVVAALFWVRDGKVVTKTWQTMEDERVCPICGSLHFQEVPLRGSFVAYNGRVFEHPPAHPLCRCFTRVSIRPSGTLDMIV